MNVTRPLWRPLLLAGVALALAAGCAANDEGGSPSTEPVSTTAVPGTEPAGTTVTTSATTASTTRTASSMARTLTNDATEARLKEQYGLDIDDKAAACIAADVTVDADLNAVMTAKGNPDIAQSTKLFDILVKCLGGPRPMAHALIQSLVKDGEFTAAQAPCVENVFATMPTADLARLAGGDNEPMSRYMGPLAACMSK
jgi:hypothetical protein